MKQSTSLPVLARVHLELWHAPTAAVRLLLGENNPLQVAQDGYSDLYAGDRLAGVKDGLGLHRCVVFCYHDEQIWVCQSLMHS